MDSTTSIVAWVTEPKGRGTVGLLWSCLATVLLCTWSAIHPNLPGMRESKHHRFGRRLYYVFLCLVAPELFAYVALEELWEVKDIKLKTPEGSWSLKQCFFLRMGGFTVDSPQDNDHPICIHPTELLKLLEAGELDWPETSDEEIEDRSKADWVAKSLALIQVFWFIVNIIGRWAQGLAITTLELYTLGIVVCGIVVFFAYWQKPFDVSVPVILRPSSDFHLDGPRAVMPMGLFDKSTDKTEPDILFSGVGVFLIFGAIHIGAWNFHFASLTEQRIWRIGSVSCTAIPVLVILNEWYEVKFEKETPISKDGLFGGCMIVYMVFRLCMFVEMFMSLRAVPASVYQTPQWAQYFPSFG